MAVVLDGGSDAPHQQSCLDSHGCGPRISTRTCDGTLKTRAVSIPGTIVKKSRDNHETQECLLHVIGLASNSATQLQGDPPRGESRQRFLDKTMEITSRAATSP